MNKFLSFLLLFTLGLFIQRSYTWHYQQRYMNERFLEEIAEQQAYHAIASVYYRQFHPEYSWDDSLLKTREYMVPTKKWILKELKNQFK